MTPAFQNWVSPGSVVSAKSWKGRRVIVAGSLGASLLLIAILLLRGGSNTDASAAPSTVRETPSDEKASKDAPPSTETYPIPPEAVAAEASVPTALVPSKAAAGAVGGQRVKQPGRDRLLNHKVAFAPRIPPTAGRGPGASSANRRAASPPASPGGITASTVRHPPESELPAESATVESRKHVPLVDDQPRVHILE